jgi:hypothetical protein
VPTVVPTVVPWKKNNPMHPHCHLGNHPYVVAAPICPGWCPPRLLSRVCFDPVGLNDPVGFEHDGTASSANTDPVGQRTCSTWYSFQSLGVPNMKKHAKHMPTA